MNMNKKLLSIIALMGMVATAPLCAERLVLTNNSLGAIEVYIGQWTQMPSDVQLTHTSMSKQYLPGSVAATIVEKVSGAMGANKRLLTFAPGITSLVIKNCADKLDPHSRFFQIFVPLPAIQGEIIVETQVDGTPVVYMHYRVKDGVAIQPIDGLVIEALLVK